ncbi:transcriptional regulator with XRE-family HTH domain [Lachnospiraceae bacterium PM6-15]|uniref:helix-turn-helix domain-containing protein n=1 Tax=Ohessyouella blattaphilus TaxID=2949333 RepID=UPI003E1B11CB
MKYKDAIVYRFEELCKEKCISWNRLAFLSGVTPSTIYSLLNAKRKKIDSSTLKKLCDGLGISIKEFHDNNIFEELDPEIE